MSLNSITNTLTFPLLVLCLMLALPRAQADERHAQRESRKLEPLPKEQLSEQSLMDIYTACVKETLINEAQGDRKALTLNDLRENCQEERQNLADRISPGGLNGLDSFYVGAFNNAADKQQREKNN